jgi:hypothetical protein
VRAAGIEPAPFRVERTAALFSASIGAFLSAHAVAY